MTDRQNIKAWTDYPFLDSDVPYEEAPIREVEIISYDTDKYCQIKFKDKIFTVKSGYLYLEKGRCGDVPAITSKALKRLKIVY